MIAAAANVYRPIFDEVRDAEGFRSRRARIGYQLETERLGVSLWEVPPGEAAYPYHYHLTEEELVIVLSGAPTLRTPAGSRPLTRGDVVSFAPGEDGAHQLLNGGAEALAFLSVSTSGVPDVAVYPDANKIGVAERRPTGGGMRKFFRQADAVDYWLGEKRGRA